MIGRYRFARNREFTGKAEYEDPVRPVDLSRLVSYRWLGTFLRKDRRLHDRGLSASEGRAPGKTKARRKVGFVRRHPRHPLCGGGRIDQSF